MYVCVVGTFGIIVGARRRDHVSGLDWAWAWAWAWGAQSFAGLAGLAGPWNDGGTLYPDLREARIGGGQRQIESSFRVDSTFSFFPRTPYGDRPVRVDEWAYESRGIKWVEG